MNTQSKSDYLRYLTEPKRHGTFGTYRSLNLFHHFSKLLTIHPGATICRIPKIPDQS